MTTIPVLLGFLIVIVAVGFGACYRYLQIVRGEIGALDEELRRELALLDDAHERRIATLVARLEAASVPGAPAPGEQAPASPPERAAAESPSKTAESADADGDTDDTQLLKKPTATELTAAVAKAAPASAPSPVASLSKMVMGMKPPSGPPPRCTHRPPPGPMPVPAAPIIRAMEDAGASADADDAGTISDPKAKPQTAAPPA